MCEGGEGERGEGMGGGRRRERELEGRRGRADRCEGGRRGGGLGLVIILRPCLLGGSA